MADVGDVLGISEHIARRHYAKWSTSRQERISGIMRRVFTGTSEETQQPGTIQWTLPPQLPQVSGLQGEETPKLEFEFVTLALHEKFLPASQ
jgi:hypothetical protein